jgi:hypothetical protein
MLGVTEQKRVLYIGIEPALVDFSSMPGLDAEKVMAGVRSELERLETHGFGARWCPVDLGETAEETVKSALEREAFACVVIGAGIRVVPPYLFLFEKILNVVHRSASQARICFNTRPTDTLEAVQRWI